jgi:8-oxo-dGTP diphosphatase / 2-hydroxy-dATP diphosphatase
MGNRKQLTLCIVHEHPRVLLGMKKRGFGAGRWNGFGGKVEESESVEDAARREMREECGVEIEDMEKAGVLAFDFQSGEVGPLEVHVFKVCSFHGEPVETEEMRPQWFALDEIPFADMWPDDPHWFPFFLQGRKFRGEFLFQGFDKMVKADISEVDEV